MIPDPVTLYIVVKFGVPVMLWQKSVQIQFRDMRTCQETALQLKRLAATAQNELYVEIMSCRRQKGGKKK
jgi:hypothetical protein